MACRFGEESAEVVQRSQMRVNGFMSAFGRSDGPWTADIMRLGGHRIVLSFSERVPDGMNRREINDVKTHGGYVGQPLLAILERAVALWVGGARTGEHFIPRGEAGLLAVDDDAQFLVVPARQPAVRILLNQGQ